MGVDQRTGEVIFFRPACQPKATTRQLMELVAPFFSFLLRLGKLGKPRPMWIESFGLLRSPNII